MFEHAMMTHHAGPHHGQVLGAGPIHGATLIRDQRRNLVNMSKKAMYPAWLNDIITCTRALEHLSEEIHHSMYNPAATPDQIFKPDQLKETMDMLKFVFDGVNNLTREAKELNK